MRKIFTSVCLFLLVGAFFASAAETFKELNLYETQSYESLTEPAREPIREFFADLESKGFGEGLYLLPEPFAYLITRLVAPLNGDMNCSAVFCLDQVLRERIRAEREHGRLVMLTSDFSGINGAVLSDEWDVPKTLKRHLGSFNQELSMLIVAPSTTVDVLEHELNHAADFEKGAVAEIYSFGRSLAAAGKMAESNAGAVARFVLEMRAYDIQRIYVESHPRDTEFIFRNVDEYSGGAMAFPGAVYRQKRQADIDYKVKGYLRRVLKALADPLLSAEDREKLTSIMSRLMPSTGPYSFANLVKNNLG